MTICSKCNGYVPDIGGHNCSGSQTYRPYKHPLPQPSPLQPEPFKGQKCNMCGSTAIDHTEAQCQLNRMAKRA